MPMIDATPLLIIAVDAFCYFAFRYAVAASRCRHAAACLMFTPDAPLITPMPTCCLDDVAAACQRAATLRLTLLPCQRFLPLFAAAVAAAAAGAMLLCQLRVMFATPCRHASSALLRCAVAITLLAAAATLPRVRRRCRCYALFTPAPAAADMLKRASASSLGQQIVNNINNVNNKHIKYT